MKRSTMIKMMAVLVGTAVVGSVTGAIAWFNPVASIDTVDAPINGTAEGAYFAYGDGTTQAKAYGISKPRHLYNLAWLTYLGYFKDSQCYFELANDIDMDGWVLPPIGTTEYPFVGNFNGQDFIVSNATVSNNFSDYGRKHPGAVSSSNFKNNVVKIVGFFGVIGEYPGDAYTGAYSSAVNTAHDFGLTNVTVSTSSADTLIGMAAGYVDADIENIAVDTGSLSVASGAGTSTISPSSKISEHAIVGYTTKKKDIRRVDETIYSVNVSTGDGSKNWEFNAVDQGADAGWGGSIDMKSVTKRLQTIRSTVSPITNYAWSRTYNYHDGVKDTTYTTNKSGSERTFLKTDNDEIGHFNFISESTSIDARYALLGGGHWETSKFYKSTVHSGYKVSLDDNYLNLNGNRNGVTNGTNVDNATIWSMPAAGSSGTISYSYSGTTYYLRNNNGTLEVSTTNSTTWTVTDHGSNQITISNGNYKIHYYQNAWQLIPTQDKPAEDYYLIHNGNNYLVGATSSGGNCSNTTTQASATRFYLDNNDYVYYYSGSTKLYLAGYRQSNTNWSLRGYSSTSGGNYYGFTYSGGTLSCIRSGTRYYAYCDAGWFSTSWKVQSSSGNATVDGYHIDAIAYGSMYLSPLTAASQTGPDEYLDDTVEGMNYDEDNVTYFPLNTINNTNDFRPADTNTAYVIGGSNLTGNGSYTDTVTNVRFGYYPISGNISKDYAVGTGTFTHIYTINDSLKCEEITNEGAYEKLTDSKTALAKVLKDDGTNAYGLHFMRSPISINATTYADYLKVNRTEYWNYELPVNCIDFHLKEFGLINFISGSYFVPSSGEPANTSFFDLFQIERLDSNPNKINRILKIVSIYQHGSKAKNISYVYKLQDTGTNAIFYTKPYKIVDVEGNREWLYDTTTPYSNNQYVDTLPSNYTTVFNTSRIGVHSDTKTNFEKHVFYFEIPMNDGEFCLGSMAESSGCYLMYLDIAANAAKTQRTIISEHYKLLEETFTYPLGVAFNVYSSSGVDDTDSAGMTVPTGFAGKTLSVTRSGNALTVKENNVITLTGDLTYLGDDLTIASNIQEKLKPKESTSKEIKRLQYFDWNVNLETLTKTIITDTYIDGAATPTRTIEQFKQNSDSSWTQVESANVKVFQTKNGVAYDLNTILSPTSVALNSAIDSGGLGWTDPGSTVLLEIKYKLEEGGDAESTFLLNMDVDDSITDGHYFAFHDYAFTITATGNAFVITVVTKGSGTVTINGTTVTAAGQTITVTVGS